MKLIVRKKDFLIILSIILIVSLFFNVYFYFKDKSLTYIVNQNIKKENSIKNTKNYGYEIRGGYLYIDYPIFIKYKKNNIRNILDKFNGFNASSIYIKNINGTDFNFLKIIGSKLHFLSYSFEFYDYDDDLNYIFDNIEPRYNLNIDLNFKKPLRGVFTLIKTISKIDNIINSYLDNNSINLPDFIGKFSINFFGDAYDTFKLSKEELDLLLKMRINILMGRIKFEDFISDTYFKNAIRNSSIENIFLFKKYSKENGKVYFINDFSGKEETK